MQLNVTGRHVDVTPMQPDYVEVQLERLGRVQSTWM